MKYIKTQGFSLLEFTITMVIIGIMFSTGALLISESTKNYYSQKTLSTGISQNNIQINRLSNYLSPLFKNMQTPLYLSPTKDEIIIAIATTGFGQEIESDQIYLSQLVKINS